MTTYGYLGNYDLDYEVVQVYYPIIQLFLLPQLVTAGATSAGQELRLPKNAVVESYPITISAGRMDWALALNVATARAQSEITASTTSVDLVFDFGMPRTVGGVGSLDMKVGITSVSCWTGVKFEGSVEGALAFGLPSRMTFEEQLTQRIKVTVTKPAGEAMDEKALASALAVRLPSEPADFDVRINNGPPVWSFPGPVVHGSKAWTAPVASSGTAPAPAQSPLAGLSSIEVDIGAALTRLCGDARADKDPTKDADLDRLQVVLTARSPGALALTLPASDAQKIGYVRRITEGFENEKKTLTFENEGLQVIDLKVPDWAKTAKQISFVLTAKLPPERTLPAVGPTAMALAELALDSARAATVRLSPVAGQRLSELVGVRLPLRASAGGAEARVMLLSGGAQPGELIPGAMSRPVVVNSTSEQWITFEFPSPIKLNADPLLLPWVVLVPSRGQLFWSLSQGSVRGNTRRGGPAGPWSILPQVDNLANALARVRQIGHGAAEAPVAPVVCSVVASGTVPSVEVTPTPKGVKTVLRFAAPVALTTDAQNKKGLRLEVTSRVAGVLTFSEVDVTLTT